MHPPSPLSRLWIALLALTLVGPAAYVATGQHAPQGDGDTQANVDRRLSVDVTAVECPPGYDNEAPDDVCLAYNGRVPGPTFVFHEGQTVELTLNHRVADTIAPLEVPAETRDRLTDVRYTLHRHGVSVAACDDGVAQPQGTQVCASTVDTNGSITYSFTTDFPGYWHYHDHALGLDAGVVGSPVAGPEAEHRGMFGSFLVLPEGETTDHVLDLHLLDTGVNGGAGFEHTVDVGDRFDVIVTGLGDRGWDVTVEGPHGAVLDALEIGPGVSRGVTIESAREGTYTWTARTPLLPGSTFEGTVTAT